MKKYFFVLLFLIKLGHSLECKHALVIATLEATSPISAAAKQEVADVLDGKDKGAITARAREIGTQPKNFRNPQFITWVESLRVEAKAEINAAMDADDFDRASKLQGRTQFLRELWEYASGIGL